MSVNLLTLVVGHELIRKVLEAQQYYQPAEWSRIVLPDDGTTIRPQTMLTLLTYCYATGTCSSEDVVNQTTNDPILRYLCGKRQPTEAMIRQFRRANRTILEHTLARVFRSVWGAHVHFVSSSTDNDNNRFVQEAEKRVLNAIQLDSMALDV